MIGGGVMVSTYKNKYSLAGAKSLDIKIHPNMPAGTMLFLTLDLANCAIEWAADRYRYRERIAMTSKSLGGQETTAFRISAMPEFVVMALRGFARVIAN
jgi:hypothetical protein